SKRLMGGLKQKTDRYFVRGSLRQKRVWMDLARAVCLLMDGKQTGPDCPEITHGFHDESGLLEMVFQRLKPVKNSRSS
ncbi:MAG: hypothetical protein ACKO5E_15580, partial [bacterium]